MINILTRFPKALKWTSYILTILYYMLLVGWLSEDWLTKKFNYISILSLEASVVIIGIMIGGINILQSKVISALEYSPAQALAIGYYNNFLKEIVIHLVKKGEISPKVCIYKPKSFKDLSKENIDLVKARLANKSYFVDVKNMEFESGRARDVITIHKNNKLTSYFDFPNTLTSLEPYVDYKLGSKENSYNNLEKQKLMEKLIEEFYNKLFELFPDPKLDKTFKNVTFCETDLGKFLKK